MPIKVTNEFVGSEGEFHHSPPEPNEVHVLICALDYKGTGHDLTCTLDGNNMQQLVRQCGVTDMQVLYDNQCTKEAVAAKIHQIGQRVGDNHYFIFYYSGHGTSMKDSSGDEQDGEDEALCFVGPQGQLAGKYFMTDDEFAETVMDSIHEGANILILTDCCHSGTIGDLEKEIWHGRNVISITGCTDVQTSGDIGKGGIFTHSMLLAIDHLKQTGEEEYCVGMLYNATIHEDDTVFHSKQDITINCVHGISPKNMHWPLIPHGDYKAPLNQAVHSAAASAGIPAASAMMGGDSDAMAQQILQLLTSNPALLQQFGIPPAMAQHIGGLSSVIGGGAPQDFLSAIQGVDPGLLSKCGGCSVM